MPHTADQILVTQKSGKTRSRKRTHFFSFQKFWHTIQLRYLWAGMWTLAYSYFFVANQLNDGLIRCNVNYLSPQRKRCRCLYKMNYLNFTTKSFCDQVAINELRWKSNVGKLESFTLLLLLDTSYVHIFIQLMWNTYLAFIYCLPKST